jgi:hypothetical protein
MKRAVLLSALLLLVAGYVFLQTIAPAPKLATLMPGGALLYLEAPDFGRLLRDWNSSKVKADWLESADYDSFSRSNLFSKLQDVYGQYGQAAGFLPDLAGITEIAGTDSALALYQIRDVEFLYVSRIASADLMKSRLWAVRTKFEQRQAAGQSFYLRTDPASKRTVAFAFVNGYLLLATRDDLVAQSLALIAGQQNPSLASDRWYRDAVAAAANPGELRLAMNLESLVKSVYFRSYWVQRNASTVRRYWAGVADMKRTAEGIVESRVFLRAPASEESTPPGSAISTLLALVPPEAGLYKASPAGESSGTATFIVRKLIGVAPQLSSDWRTAPAAASPDTVNGSEGDLETRIDEQPLPSDPGTSDSIAAIRAMLEKNGTSALLLLQSSSPAGGTFIETPSVIVLYGAAPWDSDSVRRSLAAAAANLWTTSQIGAAWVGDTSGRHPIERLDGLGTLLFTSRGNLLFLADDSALLAAALDRAPAASPAQALTYAAGFRLLRERPNFERIMTALDFTSSGTPNEVPHFFSGNLASLSRALSNLFEIRMTEERKGDTTVQTVVYQMPQ